MDAKSSRLGVNSLSSLQTVKSHLSSWESLNNFDRNDHLYDHVVPGLVNCMVNSSNEKRE